MRSLLIWTLGPLGIVACFWGYWRLMLWLGDVCPEELTDVELTTKGRNQ